MKLEDTLRNHAPRPRRELRADFTKDTLSKLAETPHPRGISQAFGDFTMRLKQFTHLHKPAAIALAVIGTLVISGTATAATLGWPNVLALFGGEQHLRDGGRIVTVTTKNCRFVTAIKVTQAADSPDSVYYYKVKPTSQLTNDQLTHIVQGYCDMEAQSAQNTAALKKEGHHFDNVVGGYIDNVITAISPTSLSVKLSMPGVVDGHPSAPETHTMTFTHIDPDAAVFDRGTRINFGDLKVGDHVAISYKASGDALAHSETSKFWENNPDDMNVVLIFKNTADMTAAMKYQQYQNTDFEEVAPCDKNPSGYCTIQQMNEK